MLVLCSISEAGACLVSTCLSGQAHERAIKPSSKLESNIMEVNVVERKYSNVSLERT